MSLVSLPSYKPSSFAYRRVFPLRNRKKDKTSDKKQSEVTKVEKPSSQDGAQTTSEPAGEGQQQKTDAVVPMLLTFLTCKAAWSEASRRHLCHSVGQ